MKRALAVLIVLLLAIAAWHWWSAKPSALPAARPELSADLYPLYADADWNAPMAESVTIGTSTYAGASVATAPVLNTMDPGSVFMPFEQYYDRKLKALGWESAMDLDAGGHTGGQTGYRKDGRLVLARFRIDYHANPPDAPSECPCDVTLSLFSTD